MTLRKTFLTKMMMTAVLGMQMVAPVKAVAWGGPPHSHDSHHYNYEGDGYDPESDHPGYNVAFTKEHIKKFEAAILSNPHSALDQLVAVANHNFKNAKNGTSQLEITVNYSTQLPPGQTTELTLSPTSLSSDKVNLQLTVHPSVRKNPYTLLDALIQLQTMYNLENIATYETNEIKHPDIKKHNLHPVHHSMAYWSLINYHMITYSLAQSLGLPKEALSNHGHGTQLNWMLEQLTPLEYLETDANAKGGSVFAQRRLVDKASKNFQLFKQGLNTFTPIQKLTDDQKKQYWMEYAAAKGVTLSATDTYEVSRKKLIDQLDLANKKSLDSLNIRATQTYKQQVQNYKAGGAERDVVVKTKSLPDMLKANDREGVAQAMEKMLPWAIMEPTEKSFWTDFVDSIRHPNYANATIMFRGIDADEKLQAVTDNTGKVISGALLSKRLTAGSGSHLFKLRGLPETFETFGTSGVNLQKRVSPLTQPHTLTKMMLNHANSPNGSPFISMTYDLDIAKNFSTGSTLETTDVATFEKIKNQFLTSNKAGGIATVRIDPRRLLINSTSTYIGELEVLASMFIFPDEVLYLEKGTNYTVSFSKPASDNYDDRMKYIQVSAEDYYKRARQAVYEKTGIMMPENYEDVKNMGETQFRLGINNMEERFVKVSGQAGLRCDKVF